MAHQIQARKQRFRFPRKSDHFDYTRYDIDDAHIGAVTRRQISRMWFLVSHPCAPCDHVTWRKSTPTRHLNASQLNPLEPNSNQCTPTHPGPFHCFVSDAAMCTPLPNLRMRQRYSRQIPWCFRSGAPEHLRMCIPITVGCPRTCRRE